jgi:hypothetical protein
MYPPSPGTRVFCTSKMTSALPSLTNTSRSLGSRLYPPSAVTWRAQVSACWYAAWPPPPSAAYCKYTFASNALAAPFEARPMFPVV